MFPPVIDMTATGKKIERLMREREITVTELTCRMGFATTNAVYKWLRGETLPTLDNLVVLSSILEVAMDEIIRLKPSERGPEGVSED